MRAILSLLGLTLATASVTAQTPIRVLTHDSTRFASCQGTTYEFTANGFFKYANLELLNPANFGLNGKVKRQVKFASSVPTLTAAALAGADVVILGQTSDQQNLPLQEVALLNSFLCKGGGVVAFGNWAAQALLPITQGKLGSYTSSAFKTNASTPMTSGPFGVTNPQAVLRGGWGGGYSQLGPTGTACIVRGTSGEVVGASFAIGPGKLIVLADEEIIASTLKIGCGGAGWDVETRRMWLNAFAWTVPSSGFAFTSNDVVFEAYGTGCPPSNNVAPTVLWSGRPKTGGYLQITVWNGRPSSVGVYLTGIQRFTQGACWLHLFPILFTLPVSIDATGSASLGSAVPDTTPFLGANLLTQIVLLDDKGPNGLTTSNGTEVRFR